MGKMSREKGKRVSEEIWMPIPGYEGLYEASSQGRIKSLPKNGRKEKIISQYINNRNGYCYMSLCKSGKRRTVRVHKYIILAFKGKSPDGKPQVNHIDGNKANNRIENLEYCSQSENMIHAYLTGLEKRKGRKVICLDTMQIYETISDAARNIFSGKIKGEMLARVCRGERSHYRNMHFAFLDDFENDCIPEFKGRNKRKASVSLWR